MFLDPLCLWWLQRLDNLCRKGKVQMRKTCCADSVQVGESRGRCYVKAAALQLRSSKNLLCFVAWRAAELQLCLFQTRGSDGPSLWLVPQELVLGGIVPSTKEVSPTRVRPCQGGDSRGTWVTKKQNATKKGCWGHTVVSMWPWLVPSLAAALGAVQAYPGPSLALAPVIWVLLGCTLIIPRARLLQDRLFTPLRLGHWKLDVLLEGFWEILGLGWSFQGALLRCAPGHLVPEGGCPWAPCTGLSASLSIFTPTCRTNPRLLRLGDVPVHTLDPAVS